ncbi:MAG: hypothetical protein WCE21_01415 [Candidatus Babeliales bacterium]
MNFKSIGLLVLLTSSSYQIYGMDWFILFFGDEKAQKQYKDLSEAQRNNAEAQESEAQANLTNERANQIRLETEQQEFQFETKKQLQQLEIQQKKEELKRKRLEDPMSRYEDDLLFPNWFKTGISLPVEQYEDHIELYKKSTDTEMSNIEFDNREIRERGNSQTLPYYQPPVFISDWFQLDFTKRKSWKNKIVPQAKQALRNSANAAWWQRLDDAIWTTGSALCSVICLGATIGIMKEVKGAPKEQSIAIGTACLSACSVYHAYKFSKSAYINGRRLELANKQSEQYNAFIQTLDSLD